MSIENKENYQVPAREVPPQAEISPSGEVPPQVGPEISQEASNVEKVVRPEQSESERAVGEDIVLIEKVKELVKDEKVRSILPAVGRTLANAGITLVELYPASRSGPAAARFLKVAKLFSVLGNKFGLDKASLMPAVSPQEAKLKKWWIPPGLRGLLRGPYARYLQFERQDAPAITEGVGQAAEIAAPVVREGARRAKAVMERRRQRRAAEKAKVQEAVDMFSDIPPSELI